MRDNKKDKNRFVIEFPLNCSKKDENIIDNELNKFRKIKNEVRGHLIKESNRLKYTHHYKPHQITNEILVKFKLTEADLHKRFKYLSNKYKINASMIQKLISELYPSFVKSIYKNHKIRFKARDEYSKLSMSAKARQGLYLNKEIIGNQIINKPEHVKFVVIYNSTHSKKRKINLRIKLKINKKDLYNYQSLIENYDNYKYIRIIRRCIKGKNRYYIQIIFDGIPNIKYNKNGEIKGISNLGLYNNGNVGIDIGTSTISTVSERIIYKHELGCYKRKREYYLNLQNKIKEYSIKLEQLKIKNNPLFYNKDGTRKTKKQTKYENLKWNQSKRMLKLRLKIKECYRLISENIKLDHNQFINDLIKQGLIFKVEDMNFQALAKRSKKKTEVNLKTGKYKRKKRYGKSIGFHSPGLLLRILDKKLNYKDRELIKVNTKVVKASQYNHLTRTYNKKELKDREIRLGDVVIDRDIYSAYIISQVEYDESYVCKVIKSREELKRKKLSKKEKESINGYIRYNNYNLEIMFNDFINSYKNYIENKGYNNSEEINNNQLREVINLKGIGIISKIK